ncbi:MAG TPA: DUF488 family protein [Stellaceae bacterium]|nr:DUF488 family protein [Stellaceae bacterium]
MAVSATRQKKATTRKRGGSSRIRLKRAYVAPSAEDGARILVDRLWPRGLRKSDAAIDRWLKDLAPSTELRRWFGHEPERWPEFQRRYKRELAKCTGLLDEVRALARQRPVTLLFAARDETHNEAVVLADLLRRSTLRRRPSPARRAGAP